MNSTRYNWGLKELHSKTIDLWKSLISEFLANFFANLMIGGSCTQIEDGWFKAAAFGTETFVVNLLFGQRSGGYANPVVTMARVLTGGISILRGILYIMVQCGGSLLGALTVKYILSAPYNQDHNLYHYLLAENISNWQGLIMEFFLGLMLVLTVLVVSEAADRKPNSLACLSIGITVILGNLSFGRYTGAGINPACVLGVAFVTNNWKSHWLFWIGPASGACVATLIYTQILRDKRVPEKPQSPLLAFGRDILTLKDNKERF